jgi:hypothetical protein
VRWFPVNQIKSLGYDHLQILEKALLHLRHKMKNEAVGFELLPEKFTLTEMQMLYEAIFGTLFDKRNFRKKVAQMNYIVPLKEKQKGVAHKPARLYRFSREIYEKSKN